MSRLLVHFKEARYFLAWHPPRREKGIANYEQFSNKMFLTFLYDKRVFSIEKVWFHIVVSSWSPGMYFPYKEG